MPKRSFTSPESRVVRSWLHISGLVVGAVLFVCVPGVPAHGWRQSAPALRGLRLSGGAVRRVRAESCECPCFVHLLLWLQSCYPAEPSASVPLSRQGSSLAADLQKGFRRLVDSAQAISRQLSVKESYVVRFGGVSPACGRGILRASSRRSGWSMACKSALHSTPRKRAERRLPQFADDRHRGVVKHLGHVRDRLQFLLLLL